jgi:hypothetical protein
MTNDKHIWTVRKRQPHLFSDEIIMAQIRETMRELEEEEELKPKEISGPRIFKLQDGSFKIRLRCSLSAAKLISESPGILSLYLEPNEQEWNVKKRKIETSGRAMRI